MRGMANSTVKNWGGKPMARYTRPAGKRVGRDKSAARRQPEACRRARRAAAAQQVGRVWVGAAPQVRGRSLTREEVDVGVELALDKVLVRAGGRFQRERHVNQRVAPCRAAQQERGGGSADEGRETSRERAIRPKGRTQAGSCRKPNT